MESTNATKYVVCNLRICEENREFNILKGQKLNLKQFTKKHQSNICNPNCTKKVLYIILLKSISVNVAETFQEFENVQFIEIENLSANDYQFLRPLKNLEGLIVNQKQMENIYVLDEMSKSFKFLINGTKTFMYKVSKIVLFDNGYKWIFNVNDVNTSKLTFEEKSSFNEKIRLLIIDFNKLLSITQTLRFDSKGTGYWFLYPNLKILHIIEYSYSKIVLDPEALRHCKQLRILIKSGIYSDNWVEIVRKNPQLKLILFYNKHFKEFENIVINCGCVVEEYCNSGFGLICRKYDLKVDEQAQVDEGVLNERELQEGLRVSYLPNRTTEDDELSPEVLHEKVEALRQKLLLKKKCSNTSAVDDNVIVKND